MNVSRRTVLAVATGGLLTCCSGPAKPAPAAPTPPPSSSATGSPGPTAPPAGPTRAEIVAQYGRHTPTSWGLTVPGSLSRLSAGGKTAALTFDACGGKGG